MSYLSYQIREGTRGGRDQFKWDDVRQMSHKDREMYLGQTLMIGFLDKGGKWRKKDWYLQKEGKTQEEIDEEMKSEQRKIIDDDQKRMRIALGLEKEEKKTISETATEEEKIRLLREIREGMDFGKEKVNAWDDIQENDEQRGVGFKLNQDTLDRVKDGMDMNKFLNYDPTKLEAVGMSDNDSDDDKKKKKKKDKKDKKDKKEKKSKGEEKHKKIKKDKKSKKDKKDKKQKKEEKKHKKRQRHDSSSESSSER